MIKYIQSVSACTKQAQWRHRGDNRNFFQNQPLILFCIKSVSNRQSTSWICHQHILSSITVTNIDVTIFDGDFRIVAICIIVNDSFSVFNWAKNWTFTVGAWPWSPEILTLKPLLLWVRNWTENWTKNCTSLRQILWKKL